MEAEVHGAGPFSFFTQVESPGTGPLNRLQESVPAMPGRLSTEGERGSACSYLEVLPSDPCLDLGTSRFSLLQHFPKLEMGKLVSHVFLFTPSSLSEA